MDTWWIDEPRLLGSRNPTVDDLEQLRHEGFGVLISLLDERAQSPRYTIAEAKRLGYARHNIPVKDFHPPRADQLKRFVELISALPTDAKIVVHCEGGSGRTGTFAAAYWIAKGMPASDAIRHVRKARPHAVETPEQEASLREFAVSRKSSG